MIPFRKIAIEDKPSFDQLLVQLQPEISDLTFTNLFMWQYTYGLEVFYDSENEFWLLLAKPPKWQPFFLPPIGDWTNAGKLVRILNTMKSTAEDLGCQFFMRRIPLRLAEALQAVDPDLIREEDRKVADYLYRAEDLIQLSGRKLHGKRNHLNQFLRKYKWSLQPITTETLTQCQQMDTEWFNVKADSNGILTEENLAMSLILNNYHQFNLTGAAIFVDGKVQALTIGEKLNENTVVIHIEKANTEYNGIYAAVNQQFAEIFWPQMEFINREEDMGIEGLRKAKLSYQPITLIEKYNLFIP